MAHRPTIGFLVDSIEESYQSTVFGGVMEAARESDMSVMCFCGGAFREPTARLRNMVYDFVSPEVVDGLVVMSGTLGNAVGHDELVTLCGAYRPLPIVSVAVALDGVPSVLVDNATGMREAIAHMVYAHGRRRIAFVRGPKTNVEAERRYDVYREVLAAHEIAVDPKHVVCGTFDQASGIEAVRLLLDERHAEIDAIVAASDEIALGVVHALIERGVRVPDEIAVIGFDDVESARFCVPPLTTVRQPLHELGRRAVEMLLAQLHGADRTPEMLLHTRLVTRRSCGCGASAFDASHARLDVDLVTMHADRSARIVIEMAGALGVTVDSREARSCERLVSAFVAEIDEHTGQFMRTLEEALRVRLASGEPIGGFQDAIAALRRGMLPTFARDADQRGSAEELVHQARALTSRYAELAQRDRLTKVERLARALTDTSSALATSFDAATLAASLRAHLPQLGIERAYVSVYRSPQNPSKGLRLLFSIDDGAPLSRTNEAFPPQTLVPKGLLPEARTTFVVEPLFFHDEPLGVVLFDMGQRMGSVYETLRDQISAAIKGSALLRKTIEQDEERRKLLRYVLDVTPDMQRLQPLADLYPKILNHALGMFLASNSVVVGQSVVPPPPRGGVLAVLEGPSLVVRASSDGVPPQLDDAQVAAMHAAIEQGTVLVRDQATFIPLSVGDITLAAVRLDGGTLNAAPDVELLSTFANQASAAIRAMQLYEMAALDPLTGTHTRRFFDDWLLREVRAAFRAREPVTVLMLDMDGLKQINDGAGHLVGDEALASVGKALREATRASDLVGRYGGDEFVVILPRTPARAAERVAQRIVDALRDRHIKGPSGELPLRLSIGASTLRTAAVSAAELGKVPVEYFRRTVASLIKHADDALYRAKREGGMRVCKGRPSTWPSEIN